MSRTAQPPADAHSPPALTHTWSFAFVRHILASSPNSLAIFENRAACLPSPPLYACVVAVTLISNNCRVSQLGCASEVQSAQMLTLNADTKSGQTPDVLPASTDRSRGWLNLSQGLLPIIRSDAVQSLRCTPLEASSALLPRYFGPLPTCHVTLAPSPPATTAPGKRGQRMHCGFQTTVVLSA